MVFAQEYTVFVARWKLNTVPFPTRSLPVCDCVHRVIYIWRRSTYMIYGGYMVDGEKLFKNENVYPDSEVVS